MKKVRELDAQAEATLESLRKSVDLKQNDWEQRIDGLVAELGKRDDLPLIFSHTIDGRRGNGRMTQLEARVRVCLRRAYRFRIGGNAKIEHAAEQMLNKNFGRF